MGRSAGWVGTVASIERYDSASKNPFGAAGFDFRVEKTAAGVIHHVSARTSSGAALPEYTAPAAVAIGSGTRGRTYLTIQAGAVWQSPVSWFAQDSRWNLSPQHDLEQGGRRPIGPTCLFCHTDRVEPIPGAENRYREPLFSGQVNIGCERCHGPGSLHVAERRTGRAPPGIDHSIVNPRHLSAALRADVCRQCHLQGVERVVRRGRDLFEYRPGLPWDQFVTTFVFRRDLADYRKSVGQFEQMEASRCFAESGGKLTCVSCHDPHEKPAESEAGRFYRARCLNCHKSKGCSAPPAKRAAVADSCVACHMPRGDSSTIAHASVTDHRVPRRSEAPARPVSPVGVSPPLVPYPPGPHAAPADERERDWGIAAGRVAASAPAARSLVPFAQERLAAAVARWSQDAEAWVTLAAVKGAAGNGRGALDAARTALAAGPRSEVALTRVALEARFVGELETALGALDRLIRMSPTTVQHRLARAEVHLRRRDWGRAAADARAALAIQPLHWKARLYLAVCHHHQGAPAAARQEAATALELIPGERLRAAYLGWFREQTR
jgi:hypothetical protein